MKLLKNIQKLLTVTLVAAICPFVLGASTIVGSSGEAKKSKKYTLSNLNTLTTKAVNFSLLKTPSLYSGSTILNHQTTPQGGILLNTTLQFNKGNISYSIPYKLKLKTTKFKLPAPTPTH